MGNFINHYVKSCFDQEKKVGLFIVYGKPCLSTAQITELYNKELNL